MHKIECPKCGGQGEVLIDEYCDQYDRTHLQWDVCRNCNGHGEIEVEPEEDD